MTRTTIPSAKRTVVMFDYDGVIADSLDYFMEAFLEACRRHGCKAVSTREDFLSLFNTNMFEGMAALGITYETHRPLLETMSELLRRSTHSYRIFADMPAVLEQLAQKHELYVITSNTARVVLDHLRSNDIRCIHDVLGSEHGTSKTAKIRGLAMTRPTLPYWYVGDTVGDILEARQAGAGTVAVTWGWHDRDRLASAAPDYIVHTPHELLRLFCQEPE